MSKSDMSLAQVIEDYIVDLKIQRKSPKTIDIYLKNLRLFLKWLKQRGFKGSLEDLNSQTVKKYIFYLEEEHHKYNGHPSIPESTEFLSLYSVQGHVRTVKALSSWLQSEEYLTDNVLARLKLPKAPKMEIKVLTDGEIKALLSGVNPNISSGARNYAILLLMLDSGLRLGEVVGLKLHKIDIERGQLWVNGRIPPCQVSSNIEIRVGFALSWSRGVRVAKEKETSQSFAPAADVAGSNSHICQVCTR